MDVFTFIIIVVLIGCATGVISDYLKNRRLVLKRGADEATLAELDELRERVEVLEAIVTDEKYHLKKELESLERRA